ncbi:hypothetical protein MNQ98_14680 [Paenibacillus sp. N3/727]|uniref:hypothetical protein n=1 Tax=Paenibacillus sp. N3/727 TaxID=2925845 RepID=UPI001F532953|nr:hypothetical protein [Paenibacillus sp. N3/727]UNK15814.1 hypothetical protein MNQ98_14680 [Paenibacillus sp. N3/727]
MTEMKHDPEEEAITDLAFHLQNWRQPWNGPECWYWNRRLCRAMDVDGFRVNSVTQETYSSSGVFTLASLFGVPQA